uniref:Uncharacterized protein n=1 Tax=Oryza sativa subsp. japonica TaxID=39947 RepID=Q8S5N9_ORYSJ|nr:Hypothetical protein [Oryza sativa Japonica Group]AAM44891.1 Hypothetical protein [Oryza sativa Japonica Group]
MTCLALLLEEPRRLFRSTPERRRNRNLATYKANIATARVGVDRSGGATRLESAAAAERGGSRGYGATEVEGGNGAVAELARPVAKLAVAAEQCGGDPSDGKRRPEFAEVWRRAGAAWGERGRECRVRETRGNGRGEHGGAFYGLGKAGSRPDVAESAGEVGRRRGVVEGLTGADFRGESGGKGGGGEGDRFHALMGRGGAREPRRRGANPAAMAAVGATGENVLLNDFKTRTKIGALQNGGALYRPTRVDRGQETAISLAEWGEVGRRERRDSKIESRPSRARARAGERGSGRGGRGREGDVARKSRERGAAAVAGHGGAGWRWETGPTGGPQGSGGWLGRGLRPA